MTEKAAAAAKTSTEQDRDPEEVEEPERVETAAPEPVEAPEVPDVGPERIQTTITPTS